MTGTESVNGRQCERNSVTTLTFTSLVDFLLENVAASLIPQVWLRHCMAPLSQWQGHRPTMRRIQIELDPGQAERVNIDERGGGGNLLRRRQQWRSQDPSWMRQCTPMQTGVSAFRRADLA